MTNDIGNDSDYDDANDNVDSWSLGGVGSEVSIKPHPHYHC